MPAHPDPPDREELLQRRHLSNPGHVGPAEREIRVQGSDGDDVGHVIPAGWPHRRLNEFAARQRGVVSRAQLLELGLSASAIGRAAAGGRLVALHRGVYALVPGAALPEWAREQAALLALGSDAVLSHRTAAAIWRLLPRPSDGVEVTLARRGGLRSRTGIQLHRSASLARVEIRRQLGLRVTSAERTLLDLSPAMSDRQLERAFDEALVSGVMRRSQARAVVERHPRHPGVTRLRDLAFEDRTTTRTRAESEERLLALVRRAGLPSPEVNTGWGTFELDFFWRAEGVVIEVDGHRFHSSRRALERDHRRDAALQASGLVVLRFTRRQLWDEPERVVAEIAAALARRRAA